MQEQYRGEATRHIIGDASMDPRCKSIAINWYESKRLKANTTTHLVEIAPQGGGGRSQTIF